MILHNGIPLNPLAAVSLFSSSGAWNLWDQIMTCQWAMRSQSVRGSPFVTQSLYEEPGRAVSERKPGYPPVIAGRWLPTYGGLTVLAYSRMAPSATFQKLA
jgi:hypothetical protein